jgi:putative ABC transport system ATP-binding protein
VSADLTSAVVVCRDVAHTFGIGPTAVVAVHGASCVVAAGDRVAIAGPSGSGKSTLLHLMAGLLTPTRGVVAWPDAGPAQSVGPARRIGVVFQGPSLIPTLNVAQNVALPLQLDGVADAEVQTRTRDCLAVVDAEQLMEHLPEELSGGQAQRVAVARVIAQRPRLILADEPTGQLDQVAAHRVVDALLDAADHLDAALVVTSHDPAVVSRMTSRWAMADGRLDAPHHLEVRS